MHGTAAGICPSLGLGMGLQGCIALEATRKTGAMHFLLLHPSGLTLSPVGKGRQSTATCGHQHPAAPTDVELGLGQPRAGVGANTKYSNHIHFCLGKNSAFF